MKVLHLLKTSVGATWALRQTRELVKLGVDVHVALPSDDGLATEYRRNGVQIHILDTDLTITNPLKVISQQAKLRALIIRLNPNLVHSHFVGCTLLARIALRNLPIPLIFQVPGPLHLEHFYTRWAEILSARKKDYWIASCEWTRKRYIQSGIGKERVFLSYYGTDLAPFRRFSSGALRKELGLNSSVPIVGMIAHIYAPKYFLGQTRGLKGHEDLVDALVIVSQRHPEVIGVFVGKAWNRAYRYEKKLIQYARKRLGNRAIFLGHRNDIPRIYSDINIAVHPSLSENVGGAVESLLMQVPTIASDVGGFPDVVIEKQTGRLVPPQNPAALAKAIAHYIEAPKQAKSDALRGRELVEDLFDVQRTAKEIHRIYERIDQIEIHP